MVENIEAAPLDAFARPHDQAGSNRILGWASLITAIATVLLCLANFAYLVLTMQTIKNMSEQTEALREQIKLMQENNNIQYRALALAQRASVYFEAGGSEVNKTSQTISLFMDIGNSGNMSTEGLRYRLGCGYSQDNIIGFFSQRANFSKASIAPKSTIRVSFCSFWLKDATNIPERYMYGEAIYPDSIDKNKERITQKCSKVFIESSADNKNYNVTYAECPEPYTHSCSDDECISK